jgi:D-glycero-beta-D-manno-heptose-7-phosphate kinase
MTTDYRALIGRFRERRVLVLGDMVADEYVVGRPSRISREAPVLILHFSESFVRPGGATNTAYNLSSLGARARVVGTIGDDEMGIRLRSALDGVGVDTRGLVVDTGRPTSTATRVLAKGMQEVQQQIVRIDRIARHAVDGGARDRMIEAVCEGIREVDALLISDYENGVISPEVLDICLPEARRHGCEIIVDAHGDLFRFYDITAATPNQPEAESTLKADIESDEELRAAGQALVQGMQAQGVLITRGSEGVALFQADGSDCTFAASVRRESEVVDPTGAGDTVAAVFTLALTSGAPMPVAAYLANIAGGEVVRKVGAATVSGPELLAAVETSVEPGPV